MWQISSVHSRSVLNSHVQFVPEFVLRLDDGSLGVGSSPMGETIGVYEDRVTADNAAEVIDAIGLDGYLNKRLTQETFDAYLEQKIASFGRNNCYALSLAFHRATASDAALEQRASGLHSPEIPHICCNIINGGWHAYTNPVLSDFQEYILVSKHECIPEVIKDHDDIQLAVRNALLNLPTTAVAGNRVHRFATRDNRECIEFLMGVVDKLGLADRFDLMIDASAGDLWTDDRYRLSITDDSSYSSDEFCAYWLDLISQYPIRFLEDPFRESDRTTWSRLTASQSSCLIVGDNFYSSDAARIAEGAEDGCTHAVIIKPNQAGSVTRVREAIQTAKATGQIPITSHRSISTEYPFEADLTCLHGVRYIKIGPLLTDYSSVIRLNEILRLTERA